MPPHLLARCPCGTLVPLPNLKASAYRARCPKCLRKAAAVAETLALAADIASGRVHVSQGSGTFPEFPPAFQAHVDALEWPD